MRLLSAAMYAAALMTVAAPLAVPVAAQEKSCASCESELRELRREVQRGKAAVLAALHAYEEQLGVVERDSSRRAFEELMRLKQEMEAANRRFGTQVARLSAAELSRMEREIAMHQDMEARERQRPTRIPRVQERRGWLGVTFSSDWSERRDGRGRTVWIFHAFPTIESVEPGSPAERGGLVSGDRLVSIDGRDVRRGIAFSQVLTPGAKLAMRVEREGEQRDLMVVVAPRPTREVVVMTPPRAGSAPRPPRPPRPPPVPRAPDAPPAPAAPAPTAAMMYALTDPIALAGAQLISLRDELGEYFGVERGLLLLYVGRGTPAARSGLVPGDVILAVNGQEVRSPQGLQSAIGDAGEREVGLLIMRKKERQELTLRW